MAHSRALVALSLLLAPASAWIAISPAEGSNVDVFNLDDSGARGNDVLSFPLNAGEVIDPNAMACGRCFCLILATNPQARSSTLYNMSFCAWVDKPTLMSKLPIPGVAYNLHSGEGEGDGGNGVTLLIDHTKTPQTYNVVRVVGDAINRLVDISKFVDLFSGDIYPGGTAYCSETQTLWVAVTTQDPSHDTLLTVDLNKRAVVANISIVKPALAAHFADCSSNSVGGFTIATDATGVRSVQLGMLSAKGQFNVLDSLALPKGSTLRLAGIADYLHDPRWAASEYGALLYSGPNFMGPGSVFVSSAKAKGPATLNDLGPGAIAASISVEY